MRLKQSLKSYYTSRYRIKVTMKADKYLSLKFRDLKNSLECYDKILSSSLLAKICHSIIHT